MMDTQNPNCVEPRGDLVTPIREQTIFALSAGFAAANAGEQEMQRRNRGVLSQCIEEQHQLNPPGGGGGCTPVLVPSYDHDGGPVRTHITGCAGRDWNLYQMLGGGTKRRVATSGPGETFADVTLALNEERTYTASTFSTGCSEGPLSAPVTVLHDDTVAPLPPGNFTAIASPGKITASFTAPAKGDVSGFKVLSSTVSGGPYMQVHLGILGPMTTSLTFPALGGGTTHYVVAKAVDPAGNWSLLTPEAVVVVP